MTDTAKHYYVMYMHGRADYEAGPYASFDEAKGHRQDIEGYEGIFNVIIVQRDVSAATSTAAVQ